MMLSYRTSRPNQYLFSQYSAIRQEVQDLQGLGPLQNSSVCLIASIWTATVVLILKALFVLFPCLGSRLFWYLPVHSQWEYRCDKVVGIAVACFRVSSICCHSIWYASGRLRISRQEGHEYVQVHTVQYVCLHKSRGGQTHGYLTQVPTQYIYILVDDYTFHVIYIYVCFMLDGSTTDLLTCIHCTDLDLDLPYLSAPTLAYQRPRQFFPLKARQYLPLMESALPYHHRSCQPGRFSVRSQAPGIRHQAPGMRHWVPDPKLQSLVDFPFIPAPRPNSI